MFTIPGKGKPTIQFEVKKRARTYKTEEIEHSKETQNQTT